MSVHLELDEQSFKHLEGEFEKLRKGGTVAAYKAIVSLAFKIRSEAMMRLRGKKHIVTSRLRNSIYVKGYKPINRGTNRETYTDNEGNSYESNLKTVSLGEYSLAVGTNVEYATKIEAMDSYLDWATRNVDAEKTLTDITKKNMENAMKYGIGVLDAEPRHTEQKN